MHEKSNPGIALNSDALHQASPVFGRWLALRLASRMRITMRVTVVGLLFVTWGALAAANAMTYASAKKVWEQSKGKKEYHVYAAEFSQFNNHFHLDEKDSCYALEKDPVELMLVITHRDGEQFALIEKVFTNINNEKSRCFQKTYEGIKTKVPPFLPFVLQMGMG